jgi:hypothetical protein
LSFPFSTRSLGAVPLVVAPVEALDVLVWVVGVVVTPRAFWFVLSTTARGARSLLTAVCPTPVEDCPAPPEVGLLDVSVVITLPTAPAWFTPSEIEYWLVALIMAGLTGDSRLLNPAPL